MKKYKHIVNKKINIQFNDMVLNSYKITEMRPTERFMVGLEGSGRIYDCSIDWHDKKMVGAHPTMDFDEQTLDGLAEQGFSICPFMSNMAYVLDGKKIVKPQDN